MFAASNNQSLVKNTSYNVVVPFYIYAALSFLVATILLFASTTSFTGHYFHPHILAITHTLALGWGTMIILGASHQLVPVLIESKLHSNLLGYASFVLAGFGIPFLVYGLHQFKLGWPSQLGGWLVLLGIISYLINLAISMVNSKIESIHAIYVFTATFWLLLTMSLGLAQVYNFTRIILPFDSLHYLSLHAHSGIIGWFLLLIIGVASRLIPMFLISKYNNPKLLWLIFILINASLFGFIWLFLNPLANAFNFIPVLIILVAIILFVYYCFAAYKLRIRKHVDEQMKLSLLSVVMLLLPIIVLIAVIVALMFDNQPNNRLVLTYGFIIFFGWITAIILGMTFKTLPFIMWNKIYHHRSGLGNTPNPKDLFSSKIFNAMGIAYLVGFLVFAIGILLANISILNIGAVLLLLTAVLYNVNIAKLVFHKP